jgi:K+-transporting ATPase ATPase C chain
MERDKNKNIDSSITKLIGPSIRIIIVMLAVTAVAYPLTLVLIGQEIMPTQSNGSIVNLNGKPVGSMLIAQEFTSPKFFHPRPASDSASGVDPHITPEDAYSQVEGVSDATAIPQNPLRTLIQLNIERSRSENLGAFAPDHVNVLRLNLDLIDQYPEVYNEFLEARNAAENGAT